jgi:NAD(P)-dependent dehydrogenase (short-subunit alcohol dehydrogenase family)
LFAGIHADVSGGAIDEIAATCLFLVSDGGGFITGQTIHVNGGAGYCDAGLTGARSCLR